MRDYLDIWRDVEQRSIVASGLEFRDFVQPLASSGGVLLIDYPAGWYASRSDIENLLEAIVPADWPRPAFDAFWQGTSAWWMQAGRCDVEERSEDIDRIQNRRGWKAR